MKLLTLSAYQEPRPNLTAAGLTEEREKAMILEVLGFLDSLILHFNVHPHV